MDQYLTQSELCCLLNFTAHNDQIQSIKAKTNQLIALKVLNVNKKLAKFIYSVNAQVLSGTCVWKINDLVRDAPIFLNRLLSL